MSADRTVRVIFEFESAEQADLLLKTINDSIIDESLDIKGEWSWGCELITPLDLGYGETK